MQHFEAGTNRNLVSNRFAQTQPIHTQSTNTPSQNHISNLNEECQCEDNEMEDMGLQYRSDFARSLVPNFTVQHRQSDDMCAISKYHQQQPPALQYRQTPGIESMESDAIDYGNSNAITHAGRPTIPQMESSMIYHIPQQAISHTEPSSISYTPPEAISHTQQQSIPYTSQKAIHHLPNQQSIQHPSTVSHIQQQSLQYNQPHAIAHNQPLALEQTTYICKLCMTKFSTLRKLGKHIERFHAAFGRRIARE